MRAEDARYSAHTDWFFHCTPTFDCDLQGNRRIDSDAYEVDLTVKKVDMKISLELEIISSAKVLSAISEHENGHVIICNDIYVDAEKTARRCADSVVGHKFTGTGSDLKAAQQSAVNQAAEQVCRLYRLATSEKANRISAAYDKLSEAKNPQSVAALVKEAEALDEKADRE